MKPTNYNTPLFAAAIGLAEYVEKVFSAWKKTIFAVNGVMEHNKEPEGVCIYSFRPEDGILINGYSADGGKTITYEIIFNIPAIFKHNSMGRINPWQLVFVGVYTAEFLHLDAKKHESWTSPNYNQTRIVMYNQPNPFYSI